MHPSSIFKPAVRVRNETLEIISADLGNARAANSIAIDTKLCSAREIPARTSSSLAKDPDMTRTYRVFLLSAAPANS